MGLIRNQNAIAPSSFFAYTLEVFWKRSRQSKELVAECQPDDITSKLFSDNEVIFPIFFYVN